MECQTIGNMDGQNMDALGSAYQDFKQKSIEQLNSVPIGLSGSFKLTMEYQDNDQEIVELCAEYQL